MLNHQVTEEVIDLGYRPRPWQEEFHRSRKRFSVLVVHRRGGKTVLAIRQIIHEALKCERENPRYAYLAPYFTQAKAVAWEYLKNYTRAIPGVKINEGECWVQLPNGARIRIYGADNPDALRGLYLDGAVLDEVAQMATQVWGEVVRPALADRLGWALFIGTPKGINLFSELYFAASGKADWHAAMYTILDTEALPEAEVEDARVSMSESQFAQEFMCDFAAGNTSALLSIYDVNACMGQHLRPEAYDFAPKVLGVDVARQGDDRSCIIMRQGKAVFTPQIYRGKEGFEIATLVAIEIAKHKPDAVFIDGTGGYGGAVAERLRQIGHQCIEVQFGGKAADPRYANKRAEMWMEMAKFIKSGCALPENQDMRSDLCAPTYKHNAHGKFLLESKEEIKKRGLPSPDCFIAGTMVSTPSGDIPIEQLAIGDQVNTPVGVRAITYTHCVNTDKITSVTFSDGRTLAGKGSHRVFTWDKGWVRLDALALVNEIETISAWSNALWYIRRLLFTKVRNTGFKALADTINPGGRQTRSAFFTGGFGGIITGIYQQAWRFITWMATGLTTIQQTLNAFQAKSICPPICWSDWKIQRMQLSSRNGDYKQLPLLQNGIDHQKAKSGISNMAALCGQTVSQPNLHANDAQASLSRSNLGHNTALESANPTALTTSIRRLLAYVKSAAQAFFSINIVSKRVVAISVQTSDVAETNVYNITLDRDNAYYANGILTENCGDSLALTFFAPVVPRSTMETLNQRQRAQQKYNPIQRRR